MIPKIFWTGMSLCLHLMKKANQRKKKQVYQRKRSLSQKFHRKETLLLMRALLKRPGTHTTMKLAFINVQNAIQREKVSGACSSTWFGTKDTLKKTSILHTFAKNVAKSAQIILSWELIWDWCTVQELLFVHLIVPVIRNSKAKKAWSNIYKSILEWRILCVQSVDMLLELSIIWNYMWWKSTESYPNQFLVKFADGYLGIWAT